MALISEGSATGSAVIDAALPVSSCPVQPSDPEVPGPRVYTSAPWIAGRMYAVVPLSPLAATPETEETWYSITKGRFVGVTNIHAFDQASIIRVSGAAHQAHTTQAAASGKKSAASPPESARVIALLFPTITTPHPTTCRQPIPIVDRKLVIYPAELPRRQPAVMTFPQDAVTLADQDNLEGNFYASPGACRICPKAHLRHNALPGVSFTILIACPHHPHVVEATEDFYRLFPNKAVAEILPETHKHQTCRGNLYVIKHGPGEQGQINRDLPVVDVVDADHPYLDELEPAPGLGVAPSSSTMVSLDEGPPLPLYDIDEITASDDERDEGPERRVFDLDEIIANLTLEDADPVQSSPPESPPAIPRVSTFTGPPLEAGGLLIGASEAANTTQGISHSSVLATPKKKKHSRPTPVAYVVFRGRTVGIFRSWNDVEAATSGLRFALHQGYSVYEHAAAAFQLAQTNSWEPGSGRHDPRVGARLADDPWYVVYCGINPGVFATSVECALNVLGIRASVHKSFSTYAEAREDFDRAREAGEVHLRRARVSFA
ncbi:hypothetical protein B0H13DRAFT_1898646 [Mycena leptocephala]|nr:hypothetical protein B0H13DRAFT_1898646 [Mycena leptocephala]